MSVKRKEGGRWRRLMPWIVGALVLVLVVVALRPRPVAVDLAEAVRGELVVTVDEEGETRVRDRFVVSAPVAGRVLRIEHEPGDPVVASDTVLATFQASAPGLQDARSRAEAEGRAKAAEAALGRARADLERQRAELRFAESERARYRRLAAEDVVSAERLESAEVDATARADSVAAAEFAVASARYELEVARATLLEGDAVGGRAPIELRAPIDGVVLRRLRESEAIVPAGEPLLEIADPARLEIVTDLLSSDAVRVSVGDPVEIDRWGGDAALGGQVRRVEPSGFTKISALGVEEQRVNVVVDFSDPREAWTALGDGYRVEVRIVVWSGDDVLKVPTSSLFRAPDGEWAVWAVEEGVARLRRVVLGQRNGLEAQIVEGLSAGEEVIAYPSDAISAGVSVESRETA